jgi:hypothetical protein
VLSPPCSCPLVAILASGCDIARPARQVLHVAGLAGAGSRVAEYGDAARGTPVQRGVVVAAVRAEGHGHHTAKGAGSALSRTLLPHVGRRRRGLHLAQLAHGASDHDTGDHDAARDAWEQAQAIFEDLQHPDAEQVRLKIKALT